MCLYSQSHRQILSISLVEKMVVIAAGPSFFGDFLKRNPLCLAQSSPQQPTYLSVTEVVEHIAGRRIHDATSTTSSCGASSTSDSVCWSRFFWDTGIHVCFGSLFKIIVLIYHYSKSLGLVHISFIVFFRSDVPCFWPFKLSMFLFLLCCRMLCIQISKALH